MAATAPTGIDPASTRTGLLGHSTTGRAGRPGSPRPSATPGGGAGHPAGSRRGSVRGPPGHRQRGSVSLARRAVGIVRRSLPPPGGPRHRDAERRRHRLDRAPAAARRAGGGHGLGSRSGAGYRGPRRSRAARAGRGRRGDSSPGPGADRAGIGRVSSRPRDRPPSPPRVGHPGARTEPGPSRVPRGGGGARRPPPRRRVLRRLDAGQALRFDGGRPAAGCHPSPRDADHRRDRTGRHRDRVGWSRRTGRGDPDPACALRSSERSSARTRAGRQSSATTGACSRTVSPTKCSGARTPRGSGPSPSR